MDILHSQIQQGQQYDDRLLLIPGNVVDNGQLVDVLQSEDLLELQGNDPFGFAIATATIFSYALVESALILVHTPYLPRIFR